MHKSRKYLTFAYSVIIKLIYTSNEITFYVTNKQVEGAMLIGKINIIFSRLFTYVIIIIVVKLDSALTSNKMTSTVSLRLNFLRLHFTSTKEFNACTNPVLL